MSRQVNFKCGVTAVVAINNAKFSDPVVAMGIGIVVAEKVVFGQVLHAGSGLQQFGTVFGTLISAGGRPVAVLTMAVADGRITAIQLLANPDKLGAIASGRTLLR